MTLPDGEVLDEGPEPRRCASTSRRSPTPPSSSWRPAARSPSRRTRSQGLVPGTASMQVAASGAGRLNVPAILRALDRYPYGCTEQITSRAMPLVYLNDVAIQAGLGGDPDIRGRVAEGDRRRARQPVGGRLLRPLVAGRRGLVARFLRHRLPHARPPEGLRGAGRRLRPRARQPEEPPRLCRRLRDRAARTIAYALYVLASNGRAAIGDLRYYAETKLDAFSTPLAKAQIGAALALYGDKARAEAVFRAALGDLATPRDDKAGWRDDYGSHAARRRRHADARLGDAHRHRPDQPVEPRRAGARQRALYQHAGGRLVADGGACADGEPRRARARWSTASRWKARSSAASTRTSLAAAPLVDREPRRPRRRRSASPCAACRSTPEPAGGNFYTLARSYYTLEGEPVDLAAVEQGARLVAVLDVTTTETQGARLILDDPLPAGFEIDNPHLLAGGDVAALDWLNLVAAAGACGVPRRPLHRGARPRRGRRRRSSSSPTSCAPSRPAPSPIRRRWSRTCTGPSAAPAPTAARVEVVGPLR